MDTSLNQTVRLLFHRGPKASIPLKEPLFFGILRLLRPPNFALGGFYSSDLDRLHTLFERSNSLLTNQTRKFAFSGRLSCANESVELVCKLKQITPFLQSIEVGFFLVVSLAFLRLIWFVLGWSRDKTWNWRNFARITRTVRQFQDPRAVSYYQFEHWANGNF